MSDIVSGVDSSDVVSATAAQRLAQLGFSFVARYYRSRKSHLNRLTRDEALAICAAGLQLVAVFEYAGTQASYFTSAQGTMDAQDALQQATALGQPEGSAIYFAVDYNATAGDIAGGVTSYFNAVVPIIRPKYRAGVYGSGAACTALLDARLADLSWLSQSIGFTGTPGFTTWDIKQGMPHNFAGLDTDPDDGHGEFGAFTIEAP